MLDRQSFIVNEDFIVEKFDNEILLYTEAEAKAVYLNDTAYIVWLLCKDGLTFGAMIDGLTEQYPDQRDQIRGDVMSSLESLLESGVIALNNE